MKKGRNKFNNKNDISNQNESDQNNVFIEKFEIDQSDEGDKVSKEVDHLEKAIEKQEKEKEREKEQQKEKQDKDANHNENVKQMDSGDSHIIENQSAKDMVIQISKHATIETTSTLTNDKEVENNTMLYPKEVVDIKIYDESEVEDAKFNELESFWNKDGAPSLIDNVEGDDNVNVYVSNYERNQKENSYLDSSNRSQSTSRLSSLDYILEQEEETETKNNKLVGKSKSLTEFLLAPNEEFILSKNEIKANLLKSETNIHKIKNGILNPEEELEEVPGRNGEKDEEDDEKQDGGKLDIINKINLIRAKLALNNNVDIDNMSFEHLDIYQLNFESLGLNVDNLTKEEKYILLLYMSDKRLESVWNEREAFKRAHENVKTIQMNQNKKRVSQQGSVNRSDSLNAEDTTSKQVLLNQTNGCSSTDFKSENPGSEQERNMESVYKGESPANKRRYVQNLKSFKSKIHSGITQDTNHILEKEYLGTDHINELDELDMHNRLKRVYLLDSYITKERFNMVSNMSLSHSNELFDYILQNYEMDEALNNQERFFRFYEKILIKYKLMNQVNQGKNEKTMMEMFLKGCIYIFFQDDDYIEQFLKFYEKSQQKANELSKDNEKGKDTESSSKVEKNIFNNIHFSKYFYAHVCNLNEEEAMHLQNDSVGQINLFSVMDEIIGNIMKDESLIMKIKQMQLINRIMKKEVSISSIKVAGSDVYLDIQPQFMEPVNDIVIGKNIGFFNIQVIQEKYVYNYYRYQEELHILEMNRNNSIWYNMVNYFNGWFGITQDNEETQDLSTKKNAPRKFRSSKRFSRDFIKSKKELAHEKKQEQKKQESNQENALEQTLEPESNQEQPQEQNSEKEQEENKEEENKEQESAEKRKISTSEINEVKHEFGTTEKMEENNNENDIEAEEQNLKYSKSNKKTFGKSKSVRLQKKKSKLESNTPKDSDGFKILSTKNIERSKTYIDKEEKNYEEATIKPRRVKTENIKFRDHSKSNEIKSEEPRTENNPKKNLTQENQHEEEPSDKNQVHFKKNKNEHATARLKYQNNTNAKIISFQYKGNLPQIDVNHINLHNSHLNKEKKIDLLGNYITTYFNEKVKACNLKDTNIKDYTDAHFIIERCYKYNENINKSYVHLLNFHTKKYLAVDIQNGKIAFTKKYNDTYYEDNKKVKHPISTYFQLDSISDMMKNILIEEIIKSVVNIMLT